MTVWRLVNPVMAYAWGSRDGIAAIQGRPISEQPEAELWMGAHPQAPSRLESADGTGPSDLDELIAADPVGVLGERCVERFGPRLPFLLKLLSADQPLSLQVHPDDDQASRGFEAENAAGVELDAPHRVYRDPFGKPEMLVAVTDFHVLAGFRAAHEAAASVEALGIGRLGPLVEELRGGTPTGEVFLRLLDWPAGDRSALVDEVRVASSHRASEPIAPWVGSLATRYPADPGVVGVLLLNYLTLRPSQGLFVRPGQIHAYLRGTGVEILGGSDNVVRGGLTPKHVSTADLRAVLAVAAATPWIVEPVDVVNPVTGVADWESWPVPQPEFELRRLRVDGSPRQIPPRGPAVLLCLEGKVELDDRDQRVTLGPGESAFVPATAAVLEVGGNGVLICANPGS
jgi:mannose-6-phosphate isomerase